MPRPRAPLAAVAALAAVCFAAGCGGCNEKKPAGEHGDATPATPATSAAADASAESIHALPGCHPTLAGGTVAKIAPGALSLAVAKNRALLVSTVLEAHAPPPDKGAPARARAERVLLDRMGAPTGAVEPVEEALPAGADVSTFAAAASMGADLATLTYAARRGAPAGCADGRLVAKTTGAADPRRELVTHSCRAGSMLVAAARGPLGIAFMDGPVPADGDPRTAPAVADAVLIKGLVSSPARIEAISGATIASAATAAGATSVASAYVVVRGATRELHVVRFDKNGEAQSRVEVFDKENVGTVSAAFEDDTLHVVWSSFVPEKNRSVLRWSKWPAGGAPAAPQRIGTGVLSAVSPSLAIDHGRFLLAWANGDEKTATVKVGASKNGLVSIAGLANVVSTEGVPAGEPVVALDADTMFVAWKELGRAQPEVHATAISCRE